MSLLKNTIFITVCAASSERENSFAAVEVLKLNILNLTYNAFTISHIGMPDNKTQS